MQHAHKKRSSSTSLHTEYFHTKWINRVEEQAQLEEHLGHRLSFGTSNTSPRCLFPESTAPRRGKPSAPTLLRGSGLATKPGGKRTCSEHHEGKKPPLRHRFRFRWDGRKVPWWSHYAEQQCRPSGVRYCESRRGQMDSCLLPARLKPVQERPRCRQVASYHGVSGRDI